MSKKKKAPKKPTVKVVQREGKTFWAPTCRACKAGDIRVGFEYDVEANAKRAAAAHIRDHHGEA